MKHSRPLIHNYVPVFSYNGIISSVLVEMIKFLILLHQFNFYKYIYIVSYSLKSTTRVTIFFLQYSVSAEEKINIMMNLNYIMSFIPVTTKKYIRDNFQNFSTNLNVYKKENFQKVFRRLRLISYLKS